MRILLATDAWFPQINGVVRTLDTVMREVEALGHEVKVIGPGAFKTVPMPSYPEIRLAVAPGRKLGQMLDGWQPDAVHIPVEGPVGLAARKHCLKRGWPFTTSFHTRGGDFFEKKFGVSPDIVFAVQSLDAPPAGVPDADEAPGYLAVSARTPYNRMPSR